MKLCSSHVVLQEAVGDGLAFDLFAFEENGFAAPEGVVGEGKVADALVIPAVVVVLDEAYDLTFVSPRLHHYSRDFALAAHGPTKPMPVAYLLLRSIYLHA